MTGFNSKRAAAADKFIAAEERKVGERYGDVPKLHPSEYMGESAQEPVAREWNFCERCGKRTADLTTIHTCTPPQEKNL